MSRHCSFSSGWSEHYIQNVVRAVGQWLSSYDDMRGTPLHAQMVEIKNEARKQLGMEPE